MPAEFDFLSHGGEMGALMRARDWAATPLGPQQHWPDTLKTTLRLMLASNQPMLLWWGGALVQFYNDGYRHAMGPERHPAALGQGGAACWAEIWDLIGPHIALVMAGGGATWHESRLVPVTRRGVRADVWWTYGYSPIEDSGGVQGVLVLCNDVRAEQHDKTELLRLNLELAAQIRRREEVELRQTFQLELADRLRGLSGADDIARTATELLGRHLQVAHVYYTSIDAAGGTFHISHEWKLEHLASLAGIKGALAGFGPELFSALHSGQHFAVNDIRHDPRTAPYLQAYASLGADAILVVPVIKGGRWVAALTLYLTRPYQWPPDQIALVEDVAERLWNAAERAEQAMLVQRAGEERFRGAFENAALGMVLAGMDGRWIQVNRSFCAMLGYSEAQIWSQSFDDLTHPDDVQLSRAKAKQLQRGALRQFSIEKRYLHRDGHAVWAILNVALVHDEQGIALQMFATIEDISARKQGEAEQARQQQHLEERVAQRTAEIAALNAELVETVRDAQAANRAKTTFVATMSHEIRTPLNAIVGLTGLLADSPLDRQQRDCANKLLLSAQALRMLVDDILDFSKIEAGALRLEQAPFSLNAILGTTAALVSVELASKPVEALFDVAHEVPDALIGDGMRLQQILLNLTSNAVKFTEQGEIVVAVRCLRRQRGQVTLQFCVRDTGIGIAREQLAQIFEVFAQADSTTTRLYGGSGLGLAISARLADLMGSQIRVDSVAGRGSEFGFAVTLALAQQTPAAAPAARLAGAALSVLIVDDHPLARDILQRACIGFGWQASAVDSAAAGLAELRRSSAEGRDYDVMLLDWRMPGMGGLDMLRQAHGAADIGLPQVILMASVFELGQAAAASDDLYLDGIVAKPLTPASLFDAVTRAQAGDFSAIPAPPRRADRRLAGMRLLVVEDNAINQQVIEQILTRAGAAVMIAAGGLAALDALRAPLARFDAVLMDIQMPGMDGHVAARIVREELGWTDLPIIAVTAHALPEDREKSRRAGMVGHIVKPIDVDDLLDILAGRRHRAQSAAGTGVGLAAPTTPPALRLAGVAVADALKSFGGDEKKYVELLRQFVAEHALDVAEARRLFGAADQQGAARLVHGLRGMASLLQAKEVARLTGATARALRDVDGAAVLPLFDEIDAAMRVLGQSIVQFDAVGAAPATP